MAENDRKQSAQYGKTLKRSDGARETQPKKPMININTNPISKPKTTQTENKK